MRFRSDNLPLHENGMTIHAGMARFTAKRTTPSAVDSSWMKSISVKSTGDVNVPYPFKSATEMLGCAKRPACRCPAW